MHFKRSFDQVNKSIQDLHFIYVYNMCQNWKGIKK